MRVQPIGLQTRELNRTRLQLSRFYVADFKSVNIDKLDGALGWRQNTNAELPTRLRQLQLVDQFLIDTREGRAGVQYKVVRTVAVYFYRHDDGRIIRRREFEWNFAGSD